MHSHAQKLMRMRARERVGHPQATLNHRHPAATSLQLKDEPAAEVADDGRHRQLHEDAELAHAQHGLGLASGGWREVGVTDIERDCRSQHYAVIIGALVRRQ